MRRPRLRRRHRSPPSTATRTEKSTRRIPRRRSITIIISSSSSSGRTILGGFVIDLESSEESTEKRRRDESLGDDAPELLPEKSDYAMMGDMLDLSLEHFSTWWRRKCAVDTLCGLLVRDMEGRVVFSQARGSAALVDLHSLGEDYVDEVVTHVLGALARDNRPGAKASRWGSSSSRSRGKIWCRACCSRWPRTCRPTCSASSAPPRRPRPSPRARASGGPRRHRA